MSIDESLLDLLQARRGIVCAVGAGGKKTTLQHLFDAHPGRTALTATVRTTRFLEQSDVTTLVAPATELTELVSTARNATRRVAYAAATDKPGRHAGVPACLIEQLHRQCAFDATYVKADGARMRWIKAPSEDEPVLPAACRTVIAIASARALGVPLTDRIAHRVPRITEVTGAREGEPLTPEHIARLFASPSGLLRGCADRQVVPLINMVDDDERMDLATQAARRALQLTDRFDHVVLATMRRAEAPIVAVIRR